MATDVIIPARNEARNIGPIINAFAQHTAIGNVFVVVDPDTTDNTESIVDANKYATLLTGKPGKGQCVMAALPLVISERVIFCDGDITGLTQFHITDLIGSGKSMVVGIPDDPTAKEIKNAFNITEPLDYYRRYSHVMWSWPWLSGQRSVPIDLVRNLGLHGYLMELQINNAARAAKLPVVFQPLRGMRSPFRMTKQRLEEMERDRIWAIERGILK